ncbi:uncharacterized protein B0I36DRAFT_79994 [Microdochium trichocladiopsis]|uniref:Uncharacterized protein n=1 Tax=Microdochium trichocladiopsis TaxID=1682393 RepID=A0A9P8XP81_9PEZI|nr:uncharacterized protein B0I36DRAFT_79994 [Microdochium trichocladiopsis]KAH7009099.1 hypothetical protein B0I36DRAFT_79994 [Microdochium trichocladiopsis]
MPLRPWPGGERMRQQQQQQQQQQSSPPLSLQRRYCRARDARRPEHAQSDADPVSAARERIERLVSATTSACSRYPYADSFVQSFAAAALAAAQLLGASRADDRADGSGGATAPALAVLRDRSRVCALRTRSVPAVLPPLDERELGRGPSGPRQEACHLLCQYCVRSRQWAARRRVSFPPRPKCAADKARCPCGRDAHKLLLILLLGPLLKACGDIVQV